MVDLDLEEREDASTARSLQGMRPDERANALSTWRRRLELQRDNGARLERNLDVLQHLFTYTCLTLAMVGALVLFWQPRGAPVLRPLLVLGLPALLAALAVSRGWLLILETYLLNLGAYLYARVRGEVYAPFVVYGLLM